VGTHQFKLPDILTECEARFEEVSMFLKLNEVIEGGLKAWVMALSLERCCPEGDAEVRLRFFLAPAASLFRLAGSQILEILNF
jgi:hypothetical protein